MANVQRQTLLLSFPKPPSVLLRPSSAKQITPSSGHRPSDFGFIHVGSDFVDDDSLYEDDVSTSLAPASLAPNVEVDSAAFQLVLDNPNRLYAPGDTITGFLTGWDVHSTNTHVHIILEGRAQASVSIGRDPVHKERALLVYKCVHLRPQMQGLSPRFSVTIPSTIPYDISKLRQFATGSPLAQRWTQTWPVQPPYESEANHPLPPSFSLPARTSNTLRESATCSGYIEYKLTAVRSQLDPLTRTLAPDSNCQVPIWMTTLRLPQDNLRSLLSETSTVKNDLTIQTAQLGKDRQLSIYEQLRDPFRSSTPSFFFSTTTTVPKVSTSGADMHVSVSISVLSPPAGRLYNFPIPDVTVKSFTCCIQSFTGMRTARYTASAAVRASRPRHNTSKSIELRTSNRPSNAVFRPQAGEYTNQSCTITVRLPGNLTASFKTYNFWRSYRMKCDIVFAVAGKEVSTGTKSDLNIVSKAEVQDAHEQLREWGIEKEAEALSLEMAHTIVAQCVVLQ